MRARVRQFTRVAAALLAVLLTVSEANAVSLGRQCRRACADEIAACVAGGGRRLACRRQMLGRCRTEGLGVCQGSEAPAVIAGSCASPTVIAAQGGTFTGTTSGTSLLAGSCGSTGSAPEQVFQWTPAVSGTATIQTCGASTNFDTILYMRSGLCASGAEVASGCNDDACTNSTGANRASRITPTVTAGQTYFIVVDGYGSSHGNFALTVTPPGATTTTTRPPTTTTTLPAAGGGCTTPTVIVAQGGTFSGTTSGVSSLTGSCGSTATSPERVYQWTPAVSGTATIQTCGAGTNFDTVLYMRGGSCASGTAVACNDDACANASGMNRASRITLTVTAGQTYFIVVDGYGGAQGTFTLTVTPPGVSTTTLPATATTTTTRPPTTTTLPPPANLTATAPSCGEVDVRWTLSSGTVSGYNVYRKASSATAFTLVKQVGATPVFPVADTAASAATTYTYGVAAWNAAGTSAMPTVLTNTPACATAGSWVKDLGGSGTDIGYAIARDANGNVTIVGGFSGTVDFGGGPLTSASGHPSVFVAKYNSAGAHVWSRAVGGPSGSIAAAVAVDGNGDVLVTGSFAGTVDLGGGMVTSTGTVDIFLAKYAAATGAYIWAQRFGDIANSGVGVTCNGNGVAVDSSNNVFLTGNIQGVVNFGGTNLSDPSLTTDVFVAKFNAAGVHQWSKTFPNSALDIGRAIAVDRSGNVAITGYYNGSINFGGAWLPMAPWGQASAFVAEFNSSGAHLWSRGFADTNTIITISASGYGVVCDSSGNVIVTGAFGNTVDFGGGILTGAGQQDVFVAKYSSSGAFAWAQRFGGTHSDAAYAVTVDPSDNILVTGTFWVDGDFGGGPLTSAGQGDVFVAKYTAPGAFVWAKRFGGAQDDSGRGIAVDGAGNVAVTGNFSGTAAFGTQTLTSSAGSADVFLSRLLASGSL